jgi:hypothetical protein
VSGHILGPIAVVAWLIAFVWGYVGSDSNSFECEQLDRNFLYKIWDGLTLEKIKLDQLLGLKDTPRTFKEPPEEGRYGALVIGVLLGHGIGYAIHYAISAPVCLSSPLFPELHPSFKPLR